MADVCLGKLRPEAFYELFPTEKPSQGIKPWETIEEEEKEEAERHFSVVRAHRYYQYAMCLYKMWRFEDGDGLDVLIENDRSSMICFDQTYIGIETEMEE